MALLFYEGFDWAGDSADLLRSLDDNYGVLFSASYGRFGSKGITMRSGSAYIIKYFNSLNTVYMGYAFKIPDSNVGYNSTYPHIKFKYDLGIQVKFYFNGVISCSFYNGSGTQISPIISIPNISNKWVYLEIKLTISDTVGAIALRINGVEYYNGTNLDTRNGTPTDINNIEFRNINAASDTYYDDIYIDDSQFHGDVRVRYVYPNSNGSVNNFTVSPSGSNYEAVDDPGNPDDDSTYNYADTVGNLDLYKVTAPTLGTVKALSVGNTLRKDDAGDRRTKNLCRSGGSNYQGSEFIVPSSYYMNKHIWETDPQDSNPWTKEKIDAAEFGLEITA